ncbi:DUF397 domain-containing protein [Streptomyces sp. NPDC050732]|uniref:DUF397 domain-containing protein n=1 Tax=Streptomyces sp. NPDC050732 TaxID=3154632 RepID=UPI0034162FEF
MQQVHNGMDASTIEGVSWRKAMSSGGNGNCVEVAKLESGEVAVRNSRFPEGPALIYTPNEIAAFLEGAKGGEFDFAL